MIIAHCAEFDAGPWLWQFWHRATDVVDDGPHTVLPVIHTPAMLTSGTAAPDGWTGQWCVAVTHCAT